MNKSTLLTFVFATLACCLPTFHARLFDSLLGRSTPVESELIPMGMLSTGQVVLGALLVAVGLGFTFGNRLPAKYLAGMLGLVAGSAGGILSLGLLESFNVISSVSAHVVYLVGGLMGILGCFVGYSVSAIVAYLTSGLAGYLGGLLILALKYGTSIYGSVAHRQTILFGSSAVGLLLGHLFGKRAVGIASSLLGSVVSMVGLDMFTQTGLRQQLYQQALLRAINMPKIGHGLNMMHLAIAALTIVGSVVHAIRGVASSLAPKRSKIM